MARKVVAILLLCTVSASARGQDNWPQFRGPGASGLAPSGARLPESWSTTQNVAWKVEIPGRGLSSPIVWGDRLFLAACADEKQERILTCYDRRNGKMLWEKTVICSPLETKHALNSFASTCSACARCNSSGGR